MAIPRDSTCPFCGLVYDDMRTGLSYHCIYSMLWSMSDDSSQWRYKRRHTVLGLWHMIKRNQWFDHIKMCEDIQKDVEAKRLDEAEAQAEREAIMAIEMYPDSAAGVDLTPTDPDLPF